MAFPYTPTRKSYIWASLHVSLSCLLAQGQPWPRRPPFSVSGVLKSNNSRILEKPPPFPSQRPKRAPSFMTTVKVEMGNRCQQIHFEHFLCARHHASPGDIWKWRQTEACLHRTRGLVDVGLQEELGNPNNSEFLQGSALLSHGLYFMFLLQNHGVRSRRSWKTPLLSISSRSPQPTRPQPHLPPTPPQYALCTLLVSVLEHIRVFTPSCFCTCCLFGWDTSSTTSSSWENATHSSSQNSSVTWKGLNHPTWELHCEIPVPWLPSGQDWQRLSGLLLWARCYCWMNACLLNNWMTSVARCTLNAIGQGLVHFSRTFHIVVAMLYSWILPFSAKIR